MPWYQTKEGTYRYARKGSGREALYNQRGYKKLSEDTPKDLVQVKADNAGSWADPKDVETDAKKDAKG